MPAPHTSLCIAYTLWLCCGLFGLHLYYVDRYAQAFVAAHTGCLFGVGWLYDGLNMSRYVDEANGTRGIVRGHVVRRGVPPSPSPRPATCCILY